MSFFSSLYKWLTSWTSKTKQESSAGDELMTRLMGSLGRYQLLLYFLTVSVKIPLAFQMFGQIFLAPKTTTFVGDSGRKGECPAVNPKYDTPVFTNNIITEWNLICHQKWKQGFTQTIFQFGNLFGSFTFGAMSDRYGRRWAMIIACGGEFFFGIIEAFMPTYSTFVITRFLVGFFCAGTLVMVFVIVMEFIGPKHRPPFSPLVQVPFCVGHMLLPIVAYFHDDYRKYLIFNGASAFMFILFIFLLPETPRWLLAMKKTEQCIKVVEKVAKFNNLPTMEIRAQITNYLQNLNETEKKVKKGNCLDLLKSPSMRKHIIICSMEWLTLGFIFYGLAQYVGSFGGNIYINVEISAFVNCLGAMLGVPILNKYGRKPTSFVTFLMCSFSTLIMVFTYNDTARVMLASISIFCAITAWSAAYLFTSELFPTVVRSAAIGSCAMTSRVGSMLAPLVIDLGDTYQWLPPILFGAPASLVTILIIFLPETKGLDMMTTLAEERERFGKKRETIDFGTQSDQLPAPPISPALSLYSVPPPTQPSPPSSPPPAPLSSSPHQTPPPTHSTSKPKTNGSED